MVRMRQFIPFGYACQYPFLPKGKKYKGSSSTDFMKKLQAEEGITKRFQLPRRKGELAALQQVECWRL
jgi:hypothetical protein